MAEATVSPLSSDREILAQLNYNAAQNATAINVNKQISGQINSLNMNIGKVNAGINRMDANLVQISNFQKSTNMNIGKVAAAVDRLGNTFKDALAENKKGQLNSSTMTAKMNILAKKQEETNQILQNILTTVGSGSRYDAVENKLESKDATTSLASMATSLTSIDETLKRIERGTGGGGNSPTPPAPQQSSGWMRMMQYLLGPAAMVGGNYMLSNNTDMNSGTRAAGYTAGALGGGVTGAQIGARFGGLPGAAIGAGVGSIAGVTQSALFDTALHQQYGRSMGVSYSSAEEAQRKKQFLEQTKGTKFTYGGGKYYIDGYEVSKESFDAGVQQIKNAGGQPNINGREMPSGNISGFNFNANMSRASSATSASYTSSSVVSSSAPSNTIPYFPTAGASTGIGSMFNTRDVLEQQQAKIEERSKGMTAGDIVYEAADILYKAGNIRFEASSIQFMGAIGSAGGGGAGGGPGGPGSGSNYSGPGGGENYSSSGGPALSGEAKAAFDAIQSGKAQSYAGSQSSPFSGLSRAELQNAGMRRVEGRGPGGGTTYEALPLSPDEAKNAILNQGQRSGSAREAAEKYLGRKMSDEEYDYLIRATHAEAGAGKTADPKEQAMIMGSILNRARGMGENGVIKALTAKNQFQAVTGTKYNPGPSANFAKGPDGKRLASIEGAAVDYLPNVSPDQKNFTAASSAAYGAGTNIGYRDNMLAQGGSVVGGSVFNTGAPEKLQAVDDKSHDILKSRLQSGDIAPGSAVAIANSMGLNNKLGREQNLAKILSGKGSGGVTGNVADVFKGMDPNTIIDKSSDIWDSVHPDLKKYKNEVLGGNKSGTGKISLGAIMAADAVFRQAEKDGVKMKVAVGGGSNMHSKNHGALASGIGESIDVKPVDGWSSVAQAERYGIIAGKAGANRVGIPTDWHGLHIQNSMPKSLGGSGAPDMTWGYGPQKGRYGAGSDFRQQWLQGDIRKPDPMTATAAATGMSAIPTPTGTSVLGGTMPSIGYGNFKTPKIENIFEGANSPLASVGSYDQNSVQAQAYVDKMKALYSPYRSAPSNTKDTLAKYWAGNAAISREDATTLYGDPQIADIPGFTGVEAPMTNPIAGYENKPDTVASSNAAAIARTESLRREQARIRAAKQEQKKKSDDRITQAIQNRESPEPKNPTATRRQLDSVLVRHNDWWKQWSATA